MEDRLQLGGDLWKTFMPVPSFWLNLSPSPLDQKVLFCLKRLHLSIIQSALVLYPLPPSLIYVPYILFTCSYIKLALNCMVLKGNNLFLFVCLRAIPTILMAYSWLCVQWSFWQGSGNQIWYWGLNLGWLCVRYAAYPLYYTMFYIFIYYCSGSFSSALMISVCWAGSAHVSQDLSQMCCIIPMLWEPGTSSKWLFILWQFPADCRWML